MNNTIEKLINITKTCEKINNNIKQCFYGDSEQAKNVVQETDLVNDEFIPIYDEIKDAISKCNISPNPTIELMKEIQFHLVRMKRYAREFDENHEYETAVNMYHYCYLNISVRVQTVKTLLKVYFG